MARTKKKVHHSKIRSARGEKPVQVWFKQREYELLARASQGVGRTMAGLVRLAALASCNRIIEHQKHCANLPFVDDQI